MNKRFYILLIGFGAGLLALWWTDYARVPTAKQRERMSGRILPELLEVPAADVNRIVIEGGEEKRIELRRSSDGWRLTEPVESRADRAKVDALVENLKQMPKLPGLESLKGSASEYGLIPPERVLRLYAGKSETPIASLELGTAQGDRRFVRRVGQSEIDPADARVFASVLAKSNSWRDPALFDVGSFDVDALDIQGPKGHLKVQRERGRARLVEPIQAPADPLKIDGLLAQIASLRVADGDGGYVVTKPDDLAKYGLDRPEFTVALTSQADASRSLRLTIGKPVTDRPDLRYAQRGDLGDVVMVDSRPFAAIDLTGRSLRSQKLTNLTADSINAIRVKLEGRTTLLERDATGWRQTSTEAGPADQALIQDWLRQLETAQTSELFPADRAAEYGLVPPLMTIDFWEGKVLSADAKSAPPDGPPSLTLEIGRRDRLRKALYARAGGDPSVLVLPDTILQIPRGGSLAFRDKSIRFIPSGRLAKLTLENGNDRVTVEPGAVVNDFARWRMVEPTAGKVDPEAIKALVTTLTTLRAESLVGEPILPEVSGQDRPYWKLTVTTVGAAGSNAATLVIGNQAANGQGSRYAWLEGKPKELSILNSATVVGLTRELGDRSLMSFSPDQASDVTLNTPRGSLLLQRRAGAFGRAAEWLPTLGCTYVPSAAELAQVNSMITALSTLRAEKLVQPSGPFPKAAGLEPSCLEIVIHFAQNPAMARLRLGDADAAGLRYATTESGNSGRVAMLAGTDQLPWKVWLESPALPKEPFASPSPNEAKKP